MRLLVVAYSLDSGGAERSAVRVSDALAGSGHEVVLGTLLSHEAFYEVPQRVQHVKLLPSADGVRVLSERSRGRAHLIRSRFRHGANAWTYLRELRGAVTQLRPDCVVVFGAESGAVVTLSLVNSGIPVVTSERIHPDPTIYRGTPVGRLRPWIYRHGSACSVQDREVADWVQSRWSVKATVTPNHLTDDWFEVTRDQQSRTAEFLAIGRDAPQKDFDLLIRIWSDPQLRPNGGLRIVGPDDPTRLVSLAQAGGCSHLVTVEESVKDVRQLIDRSLGVVSSSRFEGLPNVVLEAMARSTPIAATRSCSFIRDAESQQALISADVGDAPSLAAAMRRIESEPATARTLSANCRRLAEGYTWQAVYQTWLTVINEAVALGGPTLARRPG